MFLLALDARTQGLSLTSYDLSHHKFTIRT